MRMGNFTVCSAPVDDVRYLCGESSVPPLILASVYFPVPPPPLSSVAMMP